MLFIYLKSKDTVLNSWAKYGGGERNREQGPGCLYIDECVLKGLSRHMAKNFHKWRP